ncbi:MAG: HD domain-containing phosphohydrolase [Candidatus Limnocylindrales bacterium]|jgi:putative two-component system response regulator
MTWDLRPPHSGNARPRVLCVDDEPVILQILHRLLEVQGFEPVTCGDPVAAIALFDDTSFDVVITDIHMPGMDGLSLMKALRERQPELPVMVVTGHGTVDTAIQALREGASGMLVKPFTGEELLGEVRRALAASQMRYEALQYRYLSPVLDSIALTLSTAIEARNLETGEHCRQLGVLSERMAAVLGRDERQRMTIRIGGYLHDIGKIGIADAILLKPGRLTDEEMAEMRRHSEIGAVILEVHEAMADIAQIVRHHHERWDGQGYPGGLAGTAIPLGGRIIAVADAFSAMTSDRIYRVALPVDRAWAELRAHSGAQFDPEIVAAFEQVVDEEGRIRTLADSIEQNLDADVHNPRSASDDWPGRLAMLPVLEPLAVTVKARVEALVEACPVAPAGDECAVIASGEGCEIVAPVAGAEPARSKASGSAA